MKNKLLITFIFAILLISFASATIKNYDDDTKTVTLKENILFIPTSKIADITLNTPLENYVPSGKDIKVAEFTVNGYKNYNNFISQINFYDLNKKNVGINKQFTLKVKVVEEIVVPEYDYVSDGYSVNGTMVYKKVQTGSHIKVSEHWEELKNFNLKDKDNLTIGIFTDTSVGDYVEWIPTIANVEINEWAAYVVANGAVTTDGAYTVVTYTSNGYFNTSGGSLTAEILVVAGGGGGAKFGAGGGGAGGIIWQNNTAIPAGNYVITVGQGGNAGYGLISDATNFGGNGTNSSFGSLYQAAGGGGGGRYNAFNGFNGGSGGGGGSSTGAGGLSVPSTQGNNGGTAAGTNAAAGGGGKGAAGSADAGGIGGNGGNGQTYNLTNGTNIYYGGGGGGGGNNGGGTGGLGGGGTGADEAVSDATNGINGTGGGGGGGFDSQAAGIGGSGIVIIRYLTADNATLISTLNSPVDYYNSTSQDVTFNSTANDLSGTLLNVSLFIDNIINQTNSSGIEGFQIFTVTIADGTHTWLVQICDASECINSTSRTFTIDSTSPTISIDSPNETFGYIYANYNLTLNFTVTDSSAFSCIWEYNNTNTTVACSNATLRTDYFNYSVGVNNGTLYANDSLGNNASFLTTWGYKILESSYSPISAVNYELGKDVFWINVSANSSLTAVALDYGGTSYSATSQGGGNYSTPVTFNSTHLGSNTLRWAFTYAGDTYYSQNQTQTVSPVLFGLCNATLTIPYVNFSFADEDTLASINASIPTSTFVYYIADSTVNKTITFSNTTENSYYDFCFDPPNQTIYVDSVIQYKGTDYPQRIYDPDALNYTNSTTNTTLYLLATADGIYVTFQILNNVDQAIEGASVSLTRTISGSTVTVANGLTGADGTVTFWLNPDFSHSLTVSKSGYTTYTTSLFPTQTSYTITLSGATTGVASDYTQGIVSYLYPESKELFNDTIYTFAYNLTTDYWEVSSFGFNLRLDNGTRVGSANSTTAGTAASFNYNVSNETIIYMDYYWIIGGNYTNVTTYWVVTNTEYTGWSIKTLFQDFNTYLDSGFFGIDNFGRYMITFLILFISIGVFSYKYGFTTPVPLAILTFAIIYFLDVVVGLIPDIRGISNLVTYLAGLIVAVVVISEVSR